ncbi:RBP protein, partial [Amia calva]|nr:RBP protein [Amia calva]
SLPSSDACCSEQETQEIAATPASRVDDIYWDRCGPLSASCEGFLKRVACFYQCSPDAARWPHPHRPAALQGVPLCQSFCQDWFEACREDLTCARNWVSDWEWSPQGNNCTGKCVPYQQMYKDGRELCESMWEDSFRMVEEGEPTEEASCGCLTLSPSDQEVVGALRAQEGNPDELDTTKSGVPLYPAPCRRPVRPPQARGSKRNTLLHKRSIFVEDVEGSGSGF